MKHDFLVRGKWNDKDHHWVIGYLGFYRYGRGGLSITAKVEGANYQYNVIPETLGKCSTLHDRHGTLVFDGDIVRYADKYLFIVRCGSHNRNGPNCAAAYQMGWYFEGIGEMKGVIEAVYLIDETMLRFPAHVAETDAGIQNLMVEIAGNIFDNPELL
jgi:hypothetical protein